MSSKHDCENINSIPFPFSASSIFEFLFNKKELFLVICFVIFYQINLHYSHFDEWYEVGWMEWEGRERRNEKEFIEFASKGVFENTSKKFLQIKLLW